MVRRRLFLARQTMQVLGDLASQEGAGASNAVLNWRVGSNDSPLRTGAAPAQCLSLVPEIRLPPIARVIQHGNRPGKYSLADSIGPGAR